MRFSFYSSICLAALITLGSALPVLEVREPNAHAAAAAATHAHAAGGAKKAQVGAGAHCAIRHKRDLEYNVFDRRNLQDHELTYEIGGKINGGSYGDIHDVVGHPDYLAKAANAKAGMKTAAPAEFKTEAEHLKAVGQLVDWGYKTDSACNQVFYIIMHRVQGTPFPKTQAYLATHGNKAARKKLVDEVIEMVSAKILHYVQAHGVFHADPNGSNVLCHEVNGKIVSVDLIDWGIAGKVAPEHVASITHEVAKSSAHAALERMY